MELIPSLRGRCDYVDNGIQAIELVRDSLEAVRRLGRASAPQYSLILLDYSLPNMDGPTVAKKIY